MRAEWNMIEPIEVTSEYALDRLVAITVNGYPPWAAFHHVFLRDADRRFVQPDEGGVTLRAANGDARYAFREAADRHGWATAFLGERVMGGVGEFLPNPLPHPLSEGSEVGLGAS